MSKTSGILYVTMQPSAELPSAEFHDWYNNEHGPLRLRLPFIQNGFRYRATDSSSYDKETPEWMAIYDTPDMEEFNSPSYLALRGAPVQSQRERDIRPSVTIDRRAYDFRSEKVSPEFRKLEEINNYTSQSPDNKEKNVVISALLSAKPGADGKEIEQWYDEEHMALLSKIPGWLRSRRFVTAAIDNKDTVEYLALHEFRGGDGNAVVNSKEWAASVATPRAKHVLDNVIGDKRLRVYNLFYTFGPAPRDVGSFVAAGGKTWESPATKTKTVDGAVESYVKTSDGIDISYKLQGSTDPEAPLVVCCNSILTDWGIWDKFVASFLKATDNKFRVLRYRTRGREGPCGNTPVTVDLLSSDIIALLDALKVPKAAAAFGVSLGGATVLNAALNYPDRIGAFMSCDTNDKSPAGNSKAWTERIEIAEKEGMTAQDGTKDKIVGDQLAEVTVRRWFVKESYDGGAMEKECERVKDMVINNNLEGFKQSVRALWEYDMQAKMKDAKVKGVFVAGSGDGVLPKTMKDMADRYGGGGVAELVVIDGAGHLPMVEKPEDVAAVATKLVS